MNKIFLIIFSICILFITNGCSKNDTENVPKKIIPEPGVLPDKPEFSGDLEQHFQEETVEPRINIETTDSLVYIQNVNLDFDSEEEQFLVLKDSNDKSTLHLLVVDFDSVRNKYIITWEDVQKNINPRTFIVSYADIVGDHNLEILFKGTGVQNEQILKIYRKTHSPAGIRLFYENIADIEVNGQIEIVEKERSSAYLLGQKNGISFPVVTFEKDNESEKLLDMIKTTFIWNYQSSRYIKAFEEKIPGEKIEEEKLKKLYNDGIEAYKDFFQGQWINTESKDSIISFDKNNNEISLFSKDILEIYRWTDFHKSGFANSINISAKNDLIHFIRKNIFIRIEKLDRIRIVVNDTEISKNINPWDGYYEKVSDDFAATVNSEDSAAEEASIKLEGEYTGKNNTISFTPDNRFIQKGTDYEKQGIFSVFRYNSMNLIEFRYINDNRIVEDKKEYRIEYSEYDLENTIVKELRLQRGDIKSLYFDISGEDPVIYKQTVDK